MHVGTTAAQSFRSTLGSFFERLTQQVSRETLVQDNSYLAGDTAISLYLGHRKSEDLDFFSIESPELQSLSFIGYPFEQNNIGRCQGLFQKK